MTNKSNQVYQEGADSTALHDGRLYQLDTLFKLTKGRKATLIPIAKLTWVLKYSTIDERRVKVADLSAPLLVYDDKKYGLTAIDGVHRLTKALRNHVGSLPVHLLTDTDLKSALIENKDTLSLESKDMSNMKNWDLNFAPSYTPKQMLEEGVFEGKYINAIKGLPASWYKLPKVLGPKDEPDESINKYEIKSRQPLSVWKENKWTTKNSPNGWFEWYCLYHEGRRLEDEDDWQIKRWRSFVARHMGQLVTHCQLKDGSKCKKQRQGLLQWGWDSTTKYTLEQRVSNLKKLGVSVDKKELEEYEEGGKTKVTKESHAIIVPHWVTW